MLHRKALQIETTTVLKIPLLFSIDADSENSELPYKISALSINTKE
jgi:hypothetical protein